MRQLAQVDTELWMTGTVLEDGSIIVGVILPHGDPRYHFQVTRLHDGHCIEANELDDFAECCACVDHVLEHLDKYNIPPLEEDPD